MVATAAAGPWDVTALVVASTGTGLSKTVVVVALVALVHARGERVAVVKPAQTGVGAGEPSEVEEMRRLTGVETCTSSRASRSRQRRRRAGRGAQRCPESPPPSRRCMRDLVLIDGAGASSGFDAACGTIADAAVGLRAAVLAVVRAGLGTLNQAALRARRCARVAARASGSSSAPGPRRQTSPPAATSRNCRPTRARRCWGRLPGGGGGMDPAAFLAVARAGLAPALGGAGSLVDRSRPEVHA